MKMYESGREKRKLMENISDLILKNDDEVSVKGGISIDIDFSGMKREYFFEVDKKLLLRFLSDTITKINNGDASKSLEAKEDDGVASFIPPKVEMSKSRDGITLDIIYSTRNAKIEFRKKEATLELLSANADGSQNICSATKLIRGVQDINSDTFSIRRAFLDGEGGALSFIFRQENGFFELTLEAENGDTDITLTLRDKEEKIIVSGILPRENYEYLREYYRTL